MLHLMAKSLVSIENIHCVVNSFSDITCPLQMYETKVVILLLTLILEMVSIIMT